MVVNVIARSQAQLSSTGATSRHGLVPISGCSGWRLLSGLRITVSRKKRPSLNVTYAWSVNYWYRDKCAHFQNADKGLAIIQKTLLLSSNSIVHLLGVWSSKYVIESVILNFQSISCALLSFLTGPHWIGIF